nr:hypothetical protein OG296_38410 [Streptomyces sp. NBC_01001]
MTHTADFLALSELLTAEPVLDPAIADRATEPVSAADGAEGTGRLVEKH